MENRRPKNNQWNVGSKSNTGCKKHPRHKQSPGVCSVCLGERLSQLSAKPSTKKANKISVVSSSSLSSSCYSSLEESPAHHKYRLASMKHGMVSGALKGEREDMFRKSRSLAAIERVREREEKKNKKKSGFWSKLLRPRKKKMEVGLVHSSMVITRVH